MIFDIDKELELIESQPEWVGIRERITSLNDTLHRNILAFDTSPDKFNQKRIEKAEADIKFFENILVFWAMNYQKMKNLSSAIDHQVNASNEGARLLGLIDDLRTANKYQYEENIILSESFVKLVESKNIDAERMDSVLKDLRLKTKEHLKWVNAKIKSIIDE